MANALIIVGASARAAAGSALRAGYKPWCIDLFADRDLRAMAPVKRCPGENYPHALPEMLDDAPLAPVLLTGAMENHPGVVKEIAARRPLLGATYQGVAAARDPRALAELAEIPGLRTCKVQLEGQSVVPARSGAPAWLVKPMDSSAGRGIRRWVDNDAEHVPADHVLQQFIAGVPISALYRAGPEGVTLLGASAQIIGDPDLGARPFQYAGSIAPLPVTPAQVTALRALGQSVVERCGLAGIFGVDLICDADGNFWPIEINPRYTASVEVIEAATGHPVLAASAALTPPRLSPPGGAAPTPGTFGKAIVFAHRDCTVPDLYLWFTPDEIADVPEAGEFTPAHRPICTLLASAANPAACLQRLHEMAGHLYTRLDA